MSICITKVPKIVHFQCTKLTNLSTIGNEMDEEKDLDFVVHEALEAAKKTFQDTISSYDYDPAYCDIRFIAWIKDVNLENRLKRIEIEEEVKE